MNVYLFELRRQARSFAVGCVVVAVLAAGLLAAAFPVYRDAQETVEGLLAGYPPEFLAAFGVVGDIFQFPGFFAFSYMYLALAAAILGAAWGLSTFGRETRSRCAEFLFARPVSRAGAFAAKLACCLTGVAVLGAVSVAVCAACASQVAPDVDAGRMVAASCAIPGVALLFSGFGALLGVASRRIRSVSGWASGLGLIGFVLSSMPTLLDDDKLKAVSPFSYFDVARMLDEGSFDAGLLALAACVVLACFGIALALYARRDVRA